MRQRSGRKPRLPQPRRTRPTLWQTPRPPMGWVPITAPNLGTFYRAPKPGVAPYVEVGQRIGEATEVCLIEVMKLFTPVRAGVSGRIARACVEDGEMVEFGAPLFLVEPESETAETA